MAEGLIAQDRACAQCGLPVKGRSIHCSDTCKNKTHHQRKVAKGYVYRPSVEKHGRTCEVCGTVFARVKRQDDAARCCSRACGFALRRWQCERQKAYTEARDMLRAWGERQRNPPKPKGPRLTPLQAYHAERRAKGCKLCGGPLAVGVLWQHSCETCRSANRKEQRRAGKANRRAKLRAVEREWVVPFKVFERDGWRCHMCKRKTPQRLRGTYLPNAPELDHIVPLAMGGGHTYANTACSCRSCNGKKGATTYGQPSLFAYSPRQANLTA